MNILTRFFVPLALLCCLQSLSAQEAYQKRIEELKTLREQVETQEKEALKDEIRSIETRERDGELTEGEARTLKEEAARKRALNIQDRMDMIDREIALLERNEGDVLGSRRAYAVDSESAEIRIRVNEDPWVVWHGHHRSPPRDRRTYSDLVVAVGFNNALSKGQSLEESPYKLAGSRFFEMGWAWRTRVFQHSNWLRLHYGFSFQFNGLKPENNQYFVADGGETTLQEFEYELDKSKFRMDNLVFPVHFEVGPSRYREYKDRFRYSLKKQFRLGFGGYAGFNMSTRQKLKYTRNGDRVKDKLKRGYNTSDFIYGLSAYAGVDRVLLYAKYDLNPVFQNAETDQHNVSLGLRFDL